ncbi:MAG: nucleoside transporter C-terminal domain-containing protein [Pseudomonadota bacterium]
MQAAIGLLTFLALALAIGRRPGAVRWPLIAAGLGLQGALAFALLRVPAFADGLLYLNGLVLLIERATVAGASFLFGYLGGGDLPFDDANPSALFIFAFRALPQVLMFSVLVALLWHLRVLPAFVRLLGMALERSLKLSGPLATGAGASLMLGMIEAPLVVRAYLARMAPHELFALMTCGMATVAGTVMGLYAAILSDVLPGALGHVVSASLLNVIGAVLIAQLIHPDEPREASEDGTVGASSALRYDGLMDAINRGTADGLRIAVNVGAIILVFVSLVALVNEFLSLVVVADAPLSLQRVLGWLFAPLAFLIGLPWSEAQVGGTLLGTKVIINELLAYIELSQVPAEALGERSRLILVYTLCGFANFSSLGILTAGLLTLIPGRRELVLSLAPKAVVAGTLTNLLTGAWVGLLT